MLYMSVKERIIEYLDYKKISKSEFGREIGVSSAYISSMRKSFQPDKIQSIASKYPDLDINWLLTGKGSMLKEEPKASLNLSVEDLWELVKSQQRTIENLTKK